MTETSSFITIQLTTFINSSFSHKDMLYILLNSFLPLVVAGILKYCLHGYHHNGPCCPQHYTLPCRYSKSKSLIVIKPDSMPQNLSKSSQWELPPNYVKL